MALPRVLLTRALPGTDQQPRLADQVDLVDLEGRDPDPDDLATAQGIIVVLPSRLTAEDIEHAPHLRVIASYSAGTDHVDVAAATSRGIPVVSGQGANARAVAEYTVAAAITAHRRLPPMSAALEGEELDWQGRLVTYWPMDEFAGSTVGLIGYGHIGRAVEEAARALGASVIVHDPYVPDLPNAVDTLDELLRRSDTVSIHVPLTDATRGLIGREELRALGPDGVLIQASRGGVVDLDALADVLDEDGLRWAVVDVFDTEPVPADVVRRLRATGRVTLTPHVAGVTAQGLDAMGGLAIDGVLDVLLRGAHPATTVNPQVFDAAGATR